MATSTTDKVFHKLEEIPSSFNLKIKCQTQRQANILLKKMQREFECQEYDYPEEKRRYYNLITYLHYFCRQLDEARRCNSEALKMDPESIVALANQAWISYQENGPDEECQEVERIIRKAATICSNRVKFLEARAEIAYSYARVGILYYKEADNIYQTVLNQVKDEDKLPSFLWQYGCGLIIRRQLPFHVKGKEYETEVKRAADLLYKVAKQDNIFRYKARAWAELGNLSFCAKKYYKNWQKLFPKEIDHLCEDDMFSRALENIKKVNDIPALEHYANFLKRRLKFKECAHLLQQSIVVKETSRAYHWLAHLKMTMFLQKMQGMNKGQKQKPAVCIDYCEEVRKILSDYNSASKIQQNYSAMQCKAKFLHDIGQFKDAIDVFLNIYSLLQTTDTQPEEYDRIIMVFCQIYHAKSLLGLSTDTASITQAKDLLRSAIEMSFDLKKKRRAQINLDCCGITTDHNSDDGVSHYEDKLPMMTELQKVALAEMKHLLQCGEKTTESMIEEIALCELIKDEHRVIELCTEIEERGIESRTQIDIAKHFIKNKDFDKGLFLLKQMIMFGQLPEEEKRFTIRAQVDGAMEALANNDSVLTGTRLQDAFNVRFVDQDTTDRDKLHIFFVAHKCNKGITWKLQQLFDNLTKLNITSCFDATPGSSKLGDLEDNLRKSYVIAVIMDLADLKNDDFETEFFKKSVSMAQITQMNDKRTKALVAIKLSEQDHFCSLLSDAPHVQLGNDFQQDKKMFLRDFFMQALLN